MTDKVRYAVVGLGHISQVAMLPAFDHAENSELVALVSGDAVKLETLGAMYDIEHTVGYDDFDRLCESGEIDAIYLALPNHLHCTYTERAARRGVHVLCEKPMAVTEEECERMMRACEEADVRLMIAYRLHFEPANLGVVQRILDGALGELRYFSSVFSQDVKEGDIRLAPLERGGGSVYDVGIYCVNAARALFRDEPVEVSAMMVQGSDPRFADCDMTTTATLRFPGDRLAQFTTSFGSFRLSSFRIVGTEGQVRMEPAYDYATEHVTEIRTRRGRDLQVTGKRDQFAPQLVYFSDCIRAGRTPEPDGLEGLADVRIIRAILASARSGGRPVSIEPVPQRRRPVPAQELNRPPVEKPDEIKASGPSKK